MKNRNLRVRPACCKRNFYLTVRNGVYQIAFVPPRWSFWRAELGNYFVDRSTGGSELANAKANTTSIASYVTQARSVFSPRKMKFYAGLRLPDLTGFRAEKVARPAVVDLEPPDLNALRAMDAAAPKLAENDPGAYVAHLL